jgi:hypothetical protein
MPINTALAKSKPKKMSYSSLNPPKTKLQPKTAPTNESEIRLNELVKHYKHESKRTPSIAVKRSYMSLQQKDNYRNELDRLTGELYHSPHLSVYDRERLHARKSLLKTLIEKERLPLIGSKVEYAYI